MDEVQAAISCLISLNDDLQQIESGPLPCFQVNSSNRVVLFNHWGEFSVLIGGLEVLNSPEVVPTENIPPGILLHVRYSFKSVTIPIGWLILDAVCTSHFVAFVADEKFSCTESFSVPSGLPSLAVLVPDCGRKLSKASGRLLGVSSTHGAWQASTLNATSALLRAENKACAGEVMRCLATRIQVYLAAPNK